MAFVFKEINCIARYSPLNCKFSADEEDSLVCLYELPSEPISWLPKFNPPPPENCFVVAHSLLHYIPSLSLIHYLKQNYGE